MSDRHFELPAHPNLEYYRKQAKHLQHAYETGDAAAQARVADVLGDRAAERFLLSDAQFVLAQEHGFRTWAEFRAHIQSRSTTEDRPVSRLSGMGPGSYASMADALLTDLHRNAPGALQRLRAAVPRHAAATDTATAELRDARLIIARELGFPTWRELMSFTEKEVVRLFLDLGVRPDAAPYLGRTGLHWAIPNGQLEVIRLLLQRGADPSIRDQLVQADADGWLHMCFATRWHDPESQQIHDLIESRSR
jgi:hypothetical protein